MVSLLCPSPVHVDGGSGKKFLICDLDPVPDGDGIVGGEQLPRGGGQVGRGDGDEGSNGDEWEDKFCSVTWDGAIANAETHADHGTEDYLVSSMLGAETNHLFGLEQHVASFVRNEPVASGGMKIKIRKNNCHWKYDEVHKLVKGVSEYGVGKWTRVKRAYFKTSVRKAVHLKDKWRDLLRACGLEVGSKKKVKAQEATLQSLTGLKGMIRNIARKHDARQKRK
ncbi:hypothetical protein ACP70R_019182 [Stipagrostis hirtigluma subsp. patula]